MAVQNSAGIQTLLDAERQASGIVQMAREYRTKRVKEARNQARQEIEAYKQQKEDEFKKFEAEHTSGNQAAEEEANKDADEKIKEIKAAGEKGASKVVEDLLQAVINPQLPEPAKA